VLLVVLDHVGGGFLTGGYVGVDVFFVLSGFLITGLLLSGAVKKGYVSLKEFYVRRARRILPAAALTLVATDVVAYYVLNLVRAKQVMEDSVWASFFAANIHFAQQGTDYFAREQPPSPLQHFWTLAVEEQFYLVWPVALSVVLLGSIALGLRSRAARQQRTHGVTSSSLPRLLLVIVVAGAASLAWSIYDTPMSRVGAYFSTLTRVWELALGAALAIGAPNVVRVPEAWRAVAGWAGLIGIVLAGALFSSTTAFPGYAALLPTVGAALVIAAGISGQPRLGVGRLLAIAPMRYVGDRSYTFYLWHWPFLIIPMQYEGHPLSVGVNLLLAAGAFALSIVTYALYENPIRHMRSVRVSALLWPASIALVLVVAFTAIRSINAKASRLEGAHTGRATLAASREAIQAAGAGKPLPSVVAAVKEAQGGAAIPTRLSPPVTELLDSKYVYSPPAGCRPEGKSLPRTICRIGRASSNRSIVVIGDSHAQVWLPAILHLARRDGWVVRPILNSGCSPATWLDVCSRWYRWALPHAERLHPDVTLIAGAFEGYAGNPRELREKIDRAVVRGITALATIMKRFSKSVIVVEDPPGTLYQPVDCLLRDGAMLNTCMTRWGRWRFWANDHVGARARSRGWGFLRTRGLFCARNSPSIEPQYDVEGRALWQCPLVVGRTTVYRDFDHITKPYTVEIAEPFRAAFHRALTLPKTKRGGR
jgi:peptidoglycan/LPS O-acetylase OafA/YrhL